MAITDNNMSPRTLFAVGAVWLIIVAAWMQWGPKQFFYSWHAVGAKRMWLTVVIYVLTLLYQVFMFGWLVPFGLGLWRISRK
jgi:hypothetical protein